MSRFELTRDVPVSQEKLSWELPRFLDMASKRGRIIIVIDGLNRLVGNDDNEASLSWLPLEFAPNIRVILSATTYAHTGTSTATGGGDPTGERTASELTNTNEHDGYSVTGDGPGGCGV